MCSARGEFITIQVRLAAGGLDAPDAPDFVRRQDQLLAAHGRHWAKVFGDAVSDCHFRRGFVEEVALDDETALTPSLFEREAVRAVRFRAIRDGRVLAANPLLARLRSLALGASLAGRDVLASRHFAAESLDLMPQWIQPPQPLPMVRRLATQFVGDRSANYWPSMRALVTEPFSWFAATVEELDVHHPSPAYVVELLRREPVLRPRRLGFHFARYGEGDAIARTLATWPGLAGLDELALRGVYLRDLAPLLDSPLRPLRLDLSRNQLSIEAITALLRSPVMARVNHLALGEIRSFKSFDDAACDRLVVLDAEGTYRGTAIDFLEKSKLPRLGRVTYSRARRGLDPTWMAPL
jgi:hypothetical protein